MSPYVGSGKRDRRILLQQLTATQGGSGFPVETWTDLATVWANKFEPPPFFHYERFESNADQELASYETIWTIPYMPSMDPELVEVPKRRRIIVKNRVHDIVAAQETGRRREIQLSTLAGGLL
jgi:head-tail adaptor